MKSLKISILLLLLINPISAVIAKDQQHNSWEVDSPAPDGSRQHDLSVTANGKLLFSWVEGVALENQLRFAVLEENGWTKPSTVVRIAAKLAAAPQILSLHNGSLAAAWMVSLKRPDDRFAAEIYLSRSDDGGRHWSTPVIPYSAHARIYDAQMSLAALNNGKLVLVWTDTRHLQDNHQHQLMAGIVDRNGKISSEITLDDDVCSCCDTSITAQGNDWLVAYRDHLSGEVRDISLISSRSGKLTKNRVHDDHWVISGCPSNGPDVAWHGAQAMVAWFTAADGIGRVRVAFSSDNGKTFGSPVELDADANGYVSALLYGDDSGLVAWRGRSGPEEELRVARVWPDGRGRDRTTVFKGDFPRWPSRHLRLAQSGGDTYVAWTDLSKSRVRLAKLPSLMSAGRKHAVSNAE